jgi:mono/diheme cytochrome c family protein
MIVRYFLLLLVFISLLVLGIAGLRDYSFLPHKAKLPPIEIFPDMVRQDKVKAQAPSDFFADGRGARSPIAGTVPIGYTQPTAVAAGDGAVMDGPYEVVLFAGKENYANTGKVGTNWGNGLPFEATQATIQRGHDRYQIQCAVCHGATGVGNGIATKYGLVGVANLQQQRLSDMSDGEIYNTLVNGKNTMLGYGASVQVPDRWAIVAYIRTLQHKDPTLHAETPVVPSATPASATTVPAMPAATPVQP